MFNTLVFHVFSKVLVKIHGRFRVLNTTYTFYLLTHILDNNHISIKKD